jgi:geranylgeranyl diphosphate synthase type I
MLILIVDSRLRGNDRRLKMRKEILDKKLKQITKQIEPEARKFLNSCISKDFQEATDYQISTGGKRIRPALAIISCRMLGGKSKNVLPPAAGLEILHNYTLIIDDIIDGSKLRRNKQTVWKKFGCSIADCAAMDYAAAFFQSANCSKNPQKIAGLFIKTLKIIIEGEVTDILFERSGRKNEPYIKKNRYQKIAEKDYFKMVVKKTAVLFQTSCEVGGICAGADQKQINSLKKYGLNLGIAFQIQDDILDIFGEEKKFGKKIGQDIKERKGGNIVIFQALKELSKGDQKKVQAIFKKEKISKSDIKKGMELIKKTNALKKSEKEGQKFINQAKKQLKFLPQNQWNKLLFDLADFVVKRRK